VVTGTHTPPPPFFVSQRRLVDHLWVYKRILVVHIEQNCIFECLWPVPFLCSRLSTIDMLLRDRRTGPIPPIAWGGGGGEGGKFTP
jgi:hypothetical protein